MISIRMLIDHAGAFGYVRPMRTLSILSLFLVTSAAAADWPNWRGPDRNGISKETDIQTEWPNDEPNILWKAKVGIGFSSFAVADGHVFTMGNDEGKESVFCFDALTGEKKWQHTYDCPLDPKYFEGGPTSTPTLDGKHVFTLSRRGHVFCLDAASGKVVWTCNPAADNEMPLPAWGFSGSPLVLGDRVYLNIGDAGMTLNKTDGKVVWKSDSTEAGYSTPLPIERDGKTALLIGSAKSYLAVDAATGAEIWRYKWLTRFGVNASDPVISGDRLFISSGYDKGCSLLEWKPGAAEPAEIWKNKELKTQMNPVVLIDGHLYGTDGNDGTKNPLKCVNLETGKVLWEEPGIGTGGVTATADGKLIVLSARGQLHIAQASTKEFAPIASGQILGGKCWTVPVLANARIYARNAAGDVVCVDVSK